MTPGSTDIQSLPKATQYLTNLLQLLWLQWVLSCFVISKNWHAFRHFSSVREMSGICEWVFLQVTPKTIWQNWYSSGQGARLNLQFFWGRVYYTLFQKKRNINLSIFPGTPGSLTLTWCKLQFHWHTLFSKRKVSSKMLRFFWKRVY